MLIQTGVQPRFSPRTLPATPAAETSVSRSPISPTSVGEESATLSSAAERFPPKLPNWREVTINEAMVELPQAAIDLSNLRDRHGAVGHAAQTAVSALAFARAYQGLTGATLEQKLEGASSVALGVAGVLSMVPGTTAAHASQAFMLGQAALEVTLGVRELHEELRLDKTPDWKEIATGSLDIAKGAAAFVPLFFPSTANLMTGVQVGALLAKTALESSIQRTAGE